MRTIYFDLICGASGDMILASLIELGFPVDYFHKQLEKLQIGDIRIGVERVKRNGITCTYITPEWQQAFKYRHLSEILDILNHCDYPARVLQRCELVLDRLASAESVVHGIEKEHVHFHEIGAVDTIIDVLGVCLALEYFDVKNVIFSTVTEGFGTITSEHGTMPVPVPATAQMLQGFNIKTLNISTELCTPTGAAILTALGKQTVFGFEGLIVKSGYGCGTKVFEKHPNVLRTFLLDSDSAERCKVDTISLLETDMDHISGEIMGNVAQLLLKQGALDVSWMPLFMKKGRPGYRLTVMTEECKCQKLIDLIMIHTRTLGIRVQQTSRVVADRTADTLDFMDQKVTEKKCTYKGQSFSKIEYEDLEKLSHSSGISIVELMEKYVQFKAGK